MATSIQNDVVAAVEHEISCPICLDDFEEPKCLPSCAHNVCQHCLEGMMKKSENAIECPVCRIESVIPNGGVAAFPKNHLLVRLIERTPGRKEKEAIKEALKSCKGKLESAETALKEMEDRFATSRSQAEEIKEKVKSTAESVVTKVREQETKMLSEIDQKLSQNRNEGTFETHKSNTTELCENASSCIGTVEDILQNGEPSDLKDLKDALIEELKEFSESLESRMFWANCEFTQPFDVSLTNTVSVDKFIQDNCLFGNLTINTDAASATEEIPAVAASILSGWCVPTPVVQKSIDYSKCGSLIQTVDSSSCGLAEFAPFSVALSRKSGHFVALDEETKHVHIFNEEGEPLKRFRIMYGDLWDIGVSNEDEIVVLNRESNRLLHYDMNGNFKKKFVTAPKENANPSGKLTLSFGDDRLSSPEKATFLNGKFFVVDKDSKSIVVFDKNGDFLEEMRGRLEHPCSIAADYTNGNLVVSDRGNSTVQIYSQAGHLVHHFRTEHIPLQVAFTKDYKNLLICFQIDDNIKNIQMLTYF
ncbi:hypothetical protein OS493_037762 [Desmophyllum pertusum]|uniref:RING-type domain-containing protein n=1 Tax=Desmophyllum pertusum TaxID=174260 RepID=A0A9X0CZV3_9CNID|nr:hypothetical protein OS493_037762 [Desmophyllum pertusum]